MHMCLNPCHENERWIIIQLLKTMALQTNANCSNMYHRVTLGKSKARKFHGYMSALDCKWRYLYSVKNEFNDQ